MADRLQSPSSSPQVSNPLAGLLRITWMLGGHFAAGMSVFMIAAQSSGHLSWRDVVLAVSVVMVLIARYLDIAHFKGDTADGQPATMRHFRSHALKLIIGASAGWAIAHSIGRL